jgi:hypothetical protein
MTKRLVLAGMVLLVVAMVAIAADAVTGKWVYEQPGRGGGNPTQVTLDLKADGAKLTGSVIRPMGGRGMGGGGGAPGGAAPGGAAPAPTPTPISNGKVDGNNISFETSQDFGGTTMVTSYKGVVTGNDMKLTVTRTGMDGTPTSTDFTAKKSTT